MCAALIRRAGGAPAGVMQVRSTLPSGPWPHECGRPDRDFILPRCRRRLSRPHSGRVPPRSGQQPLAGVREDAHTQPPGHGAFHHKSVRLRLPSLPLEHTAVGLTVACGMPGPVDGRNHPPTSKGYARTPAPSTGLLRSRSSRPQRSTDTPRSSSRTPGSFRIGCYTWNGWPCWRARVRGPGNRPQLRGSRCAAEPAPPLRRPHPRRQRRPGITRPALGIRIRDPRPGPREVTRRLYVAHQIDQITELDRPHLVTLRRHAKPLPADLHPLATITAGGNHHGIATLTAKGPRFRILNNRECARAQGFPDSYRWHGSPAEVKKQIGNAVTVG